MVHFGTPWQALAILIEVKFNDNITLRRLINVVGLLQRLDRHCNRVTHEEPACLARGIGLP